MNQEEELFSMAAGTDIAPEKTQSRKKEWPTDTIPAEELIRHRAYGLWLQRDGLNGSALEDWLQAEEEVLTEIKQ
jgi:hypothetical protein